MIEDVTPHFDTRCFCHPAVILVQGQIYNPGGSSDFHFAMSRNIMSRDRVHHHTSVN